VLVNLRDGRGVFQLQLANVEHVLPLSLYVETVDLGEEEPRTIVSGLVKYVPIEAMKVSNVQVGAFATGFDP
jgi:tRNA-binding EMAP/Myf-like protein